MREPVAPVPVPDTAAVVLAGGAARRFGSDKTRAEVEGRTLLERVLVVAAPMVEEVVVVGPWAPAPHRASAEPERFGGPLAALVHGLGQITARHALVLAADHPDLRPEVLRMVLSLRSEGEAVVPLRGGLPEPLVACYRSDRALAVALGLLAGDDRRLRSLVAALDVRYLHEVEWRPIDPDGRSFRDVDTVDDLHRACGADPGTGGSPAT